MWLYINSHRDPDTPPVALKDCMLFADGPSQSETPKKHPSVDIFEQMFAELHNGEN